MQGCLVKALEHQAQRSKDTASVTVINCSTFHSHLHVLTLTGGFCPELRLEAGGEEVNDEEVTSFHCFCFLICKIKCQGLMPLFGYVSCTQ